MTVRLAVEILVVAHAGRAGEDAAIEALYARFSDALGKVRPSEGHRC